MTLKLAHNIICNICNTQTETSIFSKKRMPRKARKSIVKDGWTVSEVDGQIIDFCPDCTLKHRDMIDTRKFVKKYIHLNLYPGKTKEVAIENLAQKIDEHFISIEKHLVMIEGMEDD